MVISKNSYKYLGGLTGFLFFANALVWALYIFRFDGRPLQWQEQLYTLLNYLFIFFIVISIATVVLSGKDTSVTDKLKRIALYILWSLGTILVFLFLAFLFSLLIAHPINL